MNEDYYPTYYSIENWGRLKICGPDDLDSDKKYDVACLELDLDEATSKTIIEKAIKCIRPGGFIIIEATIGEGTIGWNYPVEIMGKTTKPMMSHHYEFRSNIRNSIIVADPYDHNDLKPRVGVLSAKLLVL